MTARKRTTHQCGETMACNLCGQPYPWADLACPASAQARAELERKRRCAAHARAVALAKRFPVRVMP